MSIAERSAGSAAGRSAEWPEAFAVHVWLLPEDDNWVAVAPDFDVVTQGRDQALALRSLDEMLLSYLGGCAEEGKSYAEARRPVPFSERLRFRWQWLLSRPGRLRRRAAKEALFVPFASDVC